MYIESRIHSVLKEWVFNLPYRMQSVLMSALRGCDTARKDDNSKYLSRALRGILLNNADPTNTFIVGDGVPEEKYVTAFLWDVDSYPVHFIMHLSHAAEIVGYKHPEGRLRTWWLDFYSKVVKGLHLNPETEDQLDIRLGYTPEEKKLLGIKPAKTKEIKLVKKEKEEHEWEAGTGTSHDNRRGSFRGGS